MQKLRLRIWQPRIPRFTPKGMMKEQRSKRKADTKIHSKRDDEETAEGEHSSYSDDSEITVIEPEKELDDKRRPTIRVTETPKGMMNRQRSKRKADDEKTQIISNTAARVYHHSHNTKMEIVKALNDKRGPGISIPEDEWMDYIEGNGIGRYIFSSNVSIFKVGMFLKNIKWEAYVPQRVSLGPYHEGRPDLPPMKHHKGRAVRRMMFRCEDMNFATTAWKRILELEGKIRDIYQEPIHCDGGTLARMVCWDGCFILEVLRTLGRDPKEKNDSIFGRDPNDKNDRNEKNDPIFGENKVSASNLLKDILMLENQMPCIVLRELLRLEHPKDEHIERTLLKVLVEGTCGLFKFSEEDKSALIQCDWLITVHHLLDFLHKVIVHRPSNRVKPKDQAENCISHCLIMLQDTNKASNDIESIPPAVELKHAGIKFLPFNGGIKEINFDRNSATIYLPTVSITYGTEVLFRNLIAFEICSQSEGNYVTWYAALMNDLINSEEDVALLRSVGILTTLLGSDKEVADLFNGLCNEGTVRIENVFDGLRKDVNAHYKNKIRIQFAELVESFRFRGSLHYTDSHPNPNDLHNY